MRAAICRVLISRRELYNEDCPLEVEAAKWGTETACVTLGLLVKYSAVSSLSDKWPYFTLLQTHAIAILPA
jgi:hypothetical protein